MKPGTITKLAPREAAILMGANAANDLVRRYREDREMGVDDAADAAAAAMGALIDEATELGYSADSLAIIESFAMQLGEELFALMQERT
jgi:hypothetical protein